MATSKQSENDASYSAMSVGDVESIGAHCQMPFCRQLDFLPFRCESCKGKFCLDHRSETAHSCPQAGAWARRRRELEAASTSGSSTPKPNILTHEQQCSEPSCKTLINTALTPGVHCDTCRRNYCLKHRFQYEHNCTKLIPLGVKPPTGPTQREKGLEALSKLKAWGASKKASLPKGVSMPQSKAKQSAAAQAQSIASLKKSAKGDEKIQTEKRVYVHVEAEATTTTAKIPKGTFFYSAEFSVGRVLDVAASSLQISNVNNRVDSEESRLRVFHVEGGKLLDFGQKLGASGVKTGDTIVLLRGVGPISN